jgi:hypothetical protein
MNPARSAMAYVAASAEAARMTVLDFNAMDATISRDGLVNFAILKTVTLTEPLASCQAYARMLGDFRLGKRSFRDRFSGNTPSGTR